MDVLHLFFRDFGDVQEAFDELVQLDDGAEVQQLGDRALEAFSRHGYLRWMSLHGSDSNCLMPKEKRSFSASMFSTMASHSSPFL